MFMGGLEPSIFSLFRMNRYHTAIIINNCFGFAKLVSLLLPSLDVFKKESGGMFKFLHQVRPPDSPTQLQTEGIETYSYCWSYPESKPTPLCSTSCALSVIDGISA